MMYEIRIEWHESGLIIRQDGVIDCIVVPNFLKYNFYEEILNVCLDGRYVTWSDLNANRLLLNYEYENHFNVFINNQYVGDMPFVLLTETSIAIPIDTNDTEQLYEIYDSDLVETYLLYESELF